MQLANTSGRCPVCGFEYDCSGCLDVADAIPAPGDLTICSECAAVLVFGDNLVTRVATEQDRAGADEEVLLEAERVIATGVLRSGGAVVN